MKKLPIIILLLIAVFALGGSSLVFGQSGSVDEEINALNNKIQNQKKQMDELANKQKVYQGMIQKKQQDKASLVNQLSILENRLAKAQLDIDSTNLNIDKTNLEIQKIELDVENVNTEIENEKQHMSSLLRLMYKQDQISTMEMLLLNDSLAEFLSQAKYLENTNSKIKESLDSLKDKKDQLDQSKINLDAKNKELATLKDDLQRKKDDLSYEQDSKGIILEETKSSEAQYQSLLARAKKEQLQAEAEVASIEKIIRQKMAAKDKAKLESGSSEIAWPVTKNTITTGFHDSDYPYRKIIGEFYRKIVLSVYNLDFSTEIYEECFESMYKLSKLLFDPNMIRYHLVQVTEKVVNSEWKYSSHMVIGKIDTEHDVLNLKHSPWEHPCDNTVSTKSFVDLYDEAILVGQAVLYRLNDIVYEDKKVSLDNLLNDLGYDTGKVNEMKLQFYRSIY